MRHPIPNDALDDRLGFTGTAGSGKTYNAGSAVERVLARRGRVIIPDPLGVWCGLRLLPDGKTASPFSVVIFGGPHGDLPLTENAGLLIGETAAGMSESCILDLSEFGTKAAERRFMLGFLTGLYKHASKEPVHVVFDEADMWAPQKLLDKDGDAAKLLGMMETIVRRGRIKGFIPWLITQRPAVLSKDVLSQVDGLIAFKLTSSQDRDALEGWIEGQADKQQWKDIRAALPTLPRGTGVVWVPGRSIMETSEFPQKQTFDSSRTPKRGEKIRGAKLKALDVGALKEKIAGVESEVKANDPKLLKAEIAKLKMELKKAPWPPVYDYETTERAGKDAFERGDQAGFERGVQATVANINNIIAPKFQKLSDEMKSLFRVDLVKPKYKPDPAHRAQPYKDVTKSVAFRSNQSMVQHHSTLGTVDLSAKKLNGAIPKGELACLKAIAQRNGARREQLTVLTGYKRSSRDAYIQRLREKGYVDTDGDRIMATDAGIVALGMDYEPLPTGQRLREYVLVTLPEGERRVLEILVEQYPNAVLRDVIDEVTGYKRSSRDAYLNRLSARELVESAGRGSVKASDTLFD